MGEKWEGVKAHGKKWIGPKRLVVSRHFSSLLLLITILLLFATSTTVQVWISKRRQRVFVWGVRVSLHYRPKR
jgi:hypothetical protein